MIRAWVTAAGPFLSGVAGAILGTAVILLAFHLYQDHLALHQVINFINQQGGKILALPTTK